VALAVASLLALPWTAEGDVPTDRIPNSVTLPAAYPDSWVFVYAMDYSVAVGSFAIVDVAAGTKEYKGQFQGAFYPALIDAVNTPDLYVAETFFEKGAHGARTDVLTITEKSTLQPVAQITLPGAKRGILPGNVMDVTRDGRLALIFNFTPASSVSVVNLDKRRVLSEVPVPGCTSVYPSGTHGFSSLCADGTLVSFTLDEKGRAVGEHRSTAFNDIEKDVLYLEPATAGTMSYFVSAQGNVWPIDMTTDAPAIGEPWPLMTREEAADGWRTADGPFVGLDENGRLYVRLYRETGYDKQTDDNTEVWVYDVSTRKRVGRIPLKNGGSSIDVTRGKTPYLVVTAAGDPSMGQSIDVYDGSTGEYLRTIGGWHNSFLTLVQARR